MLTFDYTVDLQLSETLADIDRLRSHILSLPISTKTEIRLQWEALTIRTWATLTLAGHNVPKHHVATILGHTTKPNRGTATLYAIRSSYEYIHASWRANPKPIAMNALQSLYLLLYPHPNVQFSVLEQSLTELISYLSAENTHPVVQASIAHLHILLLGQTNDLGLFARMVHYLVLAKFGYDLRGYVTPDRPWQEDIRTYTHLQDTFGQTHRMNVWLAFMAESMRKNLEMVSGDIVQSRFHIEFPKSFWELTDRQKLIIRSMETPDTMMTNRQVKKRFHVSTVTASRDLAKLTSLGHLYPHGKGRSIYYTRI